MSTVTRTIDANVEYGKLVRNCRFELISTLSSKRRRNSSNFLQHYGNVWMATSGAKRDKNPARRDSERRRARVRRSYIKCQLNDDVMVLFYFLFVFFCALSCRTSKIYFVRFQFEKSQWANGKKMMIRWKTDWSKWMKSLQWKKMETVFRIFYFMHNKWIWIQKWSSSEYCLCAREEEQKLNKMT